MIRMTWWVLFMLAPAVPQLVSAQTAPTVEQQAVLQDEDEARRAFSAGRAHFEAGKYREALRSFQHAYDLSGRPELLYNVGLAADRLRYNRTALEAFRRYVQQVPDADNRIEVENRMRTLEELVRDEQAAGPPQPSLLPTTAPAETTSPVMATEEPTADGALVGQWWFWASAGAAVVAIVVGVAIASSGDDTREPVPGSDGMVVLTLTKSP